VGRYGSPDGRHTSNVRYELSLCSLFSVLAAAVGLWLLMHLWQPLLLLVIALILAGTVSPLVGWLERHHVRRSVALALALMVLVGAIVGLGVLVLPVLVVQVGALVASAPTIQGRLTDYLAGVSELVGGTEAARGAQPTRRLEQLGPYALAFVGTTAQVVILGLTTVVLAFYLLADRERVKDFVFALLPRRFHLRVARILTDMEAVVGGYVRRQALTSLLIGLFVFAVLWLVGTPYPLALAAFAAFADLIPFVGGPLALATAVPVTLPQGLQSAALVFAAIVAYHQVASHVLVPRISGQTLRLPPVAVLVALLIGGKLLGLAGALLALPLTAGLRVLVEDLRPDLPGEPQGTAAVEAATLTTATAAQGQEGARATTGHVEVLVEERGGPSSAPPPHNPAR